MKTIYLAGGLFNAGERSHNLHLERWLKKLEYTVILPQREALKFAEGDHFNIPSIVAECARFAMDSNVIYVGCIDGADADSGTAVEYGMAIAATERAIVYRTDFRTALHKEVGVNAMFTAEGTRFIYLPCYVTELQDVDAYYQVLARKIQETIQEMEL